MPSWLFRSRQKQCFTEEIETFPVKISFLQQILPQDYSSRRACAQNIFFAIGNNYEFPERIIFYDE